MNERESLVEDAYRDIWLSSRWTLVLNTLVPAAFACVVWLYAAELLTTAWNIETLPSWRDASNWAFALVWIVLFGVWGWRLANLRRAVLSDGKLEVMSLFASDSISLHDVDSVGWNDGIEKRRNFLAEIRLRTPCHFGSRLHLLPRSLEAMRVFAARVSAVRRKSDVADPKYISTI